MSAFLGICGLILAIVSFIKIIIDVVKNRSVKKSVFSVVLGIIVFFIGITATPSSTEKAKNSTDTSNQLASTQKDNTPVYKDEITFQDYSWGSDAVSVSQNENEQYFESITPGWESAYTYSQISEYSLGYRLFTLRDRNIAGYDVLNFSMYFMYGHNNGALSTKPENSELYMVTMNFDVSDISGTYEDLLQKITSIYGQGTSTSKTGNTYSTSDGAYKYTTVSTQWLGQNNTGIMLSKCTPNEGSPSGAVTDMFHNYVALSYGKTNSDTTLSKLYEEYKQMNIAAEQEKRDIANKNGL
ncbi:MAG: hypothetical protein IKH65_02470 [Clostridia bacterium]|nr:hypothetical protein [Clostridia bacterium]